MSNLNRLRYSEECVVAAVTHNSDKDCRGQDEGAGRSKYHRVNVVGYLYLFATSLSVRTHIFTSHFIASPGLAVPCIDGAAMKFIRFRRKVSSFTGRTEQFISLGEVTNL